MMKQILKLSQVTRDLSSVVFVTFLVESKLHVVLVMQEQGKANSKAVQKAGKGHKLGPPYLYVWGGLAKAMAHTRVTYAVREDELRGAMIQVLMLTQIWRRARMGRLPARMTSRDSGGQHNKRCARSVFA